MMILPILALALQTVVPDAIPTPDRSAPHRPIDLVVHTDQPRDKLTLCAAQKLHGGPIVLADQTVIPFATGFAGGSAYFALTITDTPAGRDIAGLYRKPYNARVALGLVRDVAETCFAKEYDAAITASSVKGAKPIG